MSRPALSTTQAAAVHHPLEDASVLAGAGSGKTRVLAERFVHHVLEHGLPLREVAALTFTERAAAEMRERIGLYFAEAGRPDLEADVEFAPISTIHSFCARLLRLYAVEAGLDPAFGLLEPGEARLHAEAALELTAAELHAEAPEVLRAWRYLGGSPHATLLGVYEALRAQASDLATIGWCASADLAQAEQDLEDALRSFREAAALAADADLAAAFEELSEALGAVDEIMAHDDAEVRAFELLARSRLVATVRATRKRPFTQARKALTEAMTALGRALLDEVGRQRVVPMLRETLVRFDRAYRARKRQEGVLDFADLETRTLHLLASMTARGRSLEQAPRALLVDEYQDTNPLQARILAHLRPAAPQFSVGDPKQSIYRFRGADVRVILAEAEQVGVERQHTLATSYRSHPDLVRAVGALHEALFAGGAAGVPYVALEPGRSFRAADGPLLAATFIDGGADASLGDARRIEADWLANDIRRLVSGPLRRLAEGDAGGRPYGYGDVAILLRARTALPIYERALRDAGVPYVILQGQGWLEAEEVRDLLYLLRVIHNPRDAHALAAMFTGPAFGATDDELLAVFEPHKDSEAFARWERYCRGTRHEAGLETVLALRRLAVLGDLAEVVHEALEAFQWVEVTLLADDPGRIRRAANLEKAVEVARRLDAAGRHDLGDLLAHLAALAQRGGGEGEAVVDEEGAGVVRVLTMHQSKGLEFPVVYAPDLGRRPPPTTTPYLVGDQGCVATRIVDPVHGGREPSGAYEREAARLKTAESEEALRLFYVMATRAEERLFLSVPFTGATQKGEPKNAYGWARELLRHLDVPLARGEHSAALGAQAVPVHVLGADDVPRPVPPPAPVLPEVLPEDRAALAAARERAARDTAPLGDTRFVVSVSEVLAFAASPAAWYETRILGELPEVDPGGLIDTEDPLEVAGAWSDQQMRLSDRRAAWDEPHVEARAERPGAVDRSAVGRLVHALLEHRKPGERGLEAEALERLAALEFPEGLPDAVRAEANTMVERFATSPLGVSLDEATRRSADSAMRELAFHARIRFPKGEPVAGFEALLVKGTIDLVLGRPHGVWVVDYKTNRPRPGMDRPEDLADYYAVQMRLYALAAERLLGFDVVGARLVLLDPAWGPQVLEVPVDISGPALRETRSLLRAFARAEQEGRYPDDWRQL